MAPGALQSVSAAPPAQTQTQTQTQTRGRKHSDPAKPSSKVALVVNGAEDAGKPGATPKRKGEEKGLLKRFIWRSDSKSDLSEPLYTHPSPVVEEASSRFDDLFGIKTKPSEELLAGYLEPPVAWLRVSFLASRLLRRDEDVVEELAEDPLGLRVKMGAFELPEEVVLVAPEKDKAGQPHPPSSWLFPVSRQALEIGGIELIVVNAFSRLPIGWVGVPLRGLTFVHDSIMYGMCDWYSWEPLWKAAGSIQVGLKLVKVRSSSSVRGEWNGASAGGSLDHITWVHNPQFSFTLPLQSVVSLSLTTPVAIENAAGFYLLKLRRPVHPHPANPLGDSELDGTDRYSSWLRSGSGVIDVEVFLPAGSYVVVACTQKRGIEGSFSLTLATDLAAAVALIPLHRKRADGDAESGSQSSSSQPTRLAAAPRIMEEDSESDFDDCFVGVAVRQAIVNGPVGARAQDDTDKEAADKEKDVTAEAEEWAKSEESRLFLERLAAAANEDDAFDDFDDADWASDSDGEGGGGGGGAAAANPFASVISPAAPSKSPERFSSPFSDAGDDEDWDSGLEFDSSDSSKGSVGGSNPFAAATTTSAPTTCSSAGSSAPSSRNGSAITMTTPPPSRKKAPESIFSDSWEMESPRPVAPPAVSVVPAALAVSSKKFDLKKRHSIRASRNVQRRPSPSAEGMVLNSDQMGPLQFAASHNHTSSLRCLLERGTDVNETDEVGRSALMFAAMFGHRDCMAALLEAKADPHLLDNHRRHALSYAASCGSVACVQMLVERDVSIAQRDRYGQTALLRAALGGHTDVVACLLASPQLDRSQKERLTNDQDRYGNTPLLGAAIHGLTELAKELVRVGADVSISEKHYSMEFFNKYLYHATLLGNTAVADLFDKLLRKGSGIRRSASTLAWFDAPHLQEGDASGSRKMGRRVSSTRLRSGTLTGSTWGLPVTARQWEWCRLYLSGAAVPEKKKSAKFTRTHADLDVIEILRFCPESDAYILWLITAVGGTPLSLSIICEDAASDGTIDDIREVARGEWDAWRQSSEDMQTFFELEWRSMRCSTEKLAMEGLLDGIPPLSAFKVLFAGVLGSAEFRALFTDAHVYECGGGGIEGSGGDTSGGSSTLEEEPTAGPRVLTLPLAPTLDFGTIEEHLDHVSFVNCARIDLSEYWWQQQEQLEALQNPHCAPAPIADHSPRESTTLVSARVAGYVVRKRAFDRRLRACGDGKLTIAIREARGLEKLFDGTHKLECVVQVRAGKTTVRTNPQVFKRKKKGPNALAWNQCFALDIPSLDRNITISVIGKERTYSRILLSPRALSPTGSAWFVCVPEGTGEPPPPEYCAALLIDYSFQSVASAAAACIDSNEFTVQPSEGAIGGAGGFGGTSSMSALERFDAALASDM